MKPGKPAPPLALVRQGIYQAAGGALFAGAVGLVVLWLNPAPKAQPKAAPAPQTTSSTAKVYG